MNKKNFTSFLPKSIIVTIVLTTLIVNVIKSCPLVCTCKWKGGKRKVECVNKNLTSLLAGIDSETQVLDYSKNYLPILVHRLFDEKNLTNLQKLYLSECQIAQIQGTALYALSNLIELDLSNNMLTAVPSNTFNDYPLLMKLILSGNPIRELGYRAFSPLEYLATLDLSDCRIENIEREAFEGLSKLDWLKLEGNKLKNWKFADMMPEVTSGLSLHRNPWTCDCHLRPFYTWLISVKKPPPMTAQPVCEAPKNHHGLSIAQLKFEDLACAPSVIPSSLFVEINEGKNISFACQVNAVPEADITWNFEGNPVNSNSCFIQPFYKFYAEDEITDQGSELFIVDAKKEHNGTYHCTAANVAGKSTSNFTLKVISVTTKEIPSTTTNSHFHIIVSSVGTLVLVTVIALFFIICLAYFHKKRPAASRTVENKRANVKPEIGYEVIKTDAGETSACKTDIRDPDLILNAEGTNEKLENCEQFLLLPSDIKQTYLTLTGTDGTLLNTATVYDSTPVVCAQENESLLPARCSTGPNATPATASTIKVYLSSNTDQRVHNLYVNPFDGYDNPIEENYWTIHLLKNANCGEEQHVLINCCSQAAHQSAESDRNDTLNDEVVDLRHNLEGYPYPSKLRLASARKNRDEGLIAGTPILSPPDPFKTNINSISVDVENKSTTDNHKK